MERLEGQRPRYGLPIDHEGWRATHTQRLGLGRLAAHDIGVFARVEARVESFGIQPQLGGKLLQILLAEGAPILTAVFVEEQEVMELPESILLGGALAGLRRPLRLLSEEGKMLIAEANPAGLDVLLVDLTPRVSGESPAVRSLEVAEFDHDDGGTGIALEVARPGD